MPHCHRTRFRPDARERQRRWTTSAIVLAGAVIAGQCLAGEPPPLPLTAVIGGNPVKPVVDGHLVHLPAGRTIATWDYADPATPVLRSTTAQASTGVIQGVARLGDHLYAAWSSADDNSGVAVYSLADPAAPVLVNEIDDYTFSGIRVLRGIAASDSHLYLFDSENGVFWGTADDPEHPVFTQAFQTPIIYRDPTIVGDWMYVQAQNLMGESSLMSFDLSDPEDPTPVSGSPPYFQTQLWSLQPAPPLVLGVGELLSLFDVSDPSDVLVRGQVPSPPATQGVVIGDHAWSFGFDGLDVWHIADPDQPTVAGHADIDLLGADVAAPLADGALVATRTDRLVHLDGNDPAQPAANSVVFPAGGAEAGDIAPFGDLAVILQGGYGLSIADPHTLAPLARFEADLPAQLNMRAFETLAIDGDRAVLAAWGYGLVIVDLSDPLAPVELGRQPWDFASEVAVQGDLVYAGRSTNGGELRIFDIADPAQPVPRGQFLANEVRNLLVRGDHVYMADALLGGLRIIDASDPDQPVQVAVYDQDCEWLGNTAYDVALNDAGDVAYVACPTGLHIVDVGTPALPTRIGWHALDTDWSVSRPRVAVAGDRAWLSNAAGVYEFDVSEPSDPKLLQLTPLTYTAPARLRADGDGRLFALTGWSGIHVFGEADDHDVIFRSGFEAAP